MEPLHRDDPRRLGPYRLLRRVGTGGMGVVFLAVADDGSGDDLVAVKAVRTEYAEDAEFRARFASEVALARRVRGPYTARVLDADTEGPRPWLATEYVSGPALNSAVRESGPFPEDSLRALAAGLARALDAIHSVGLIHRDLKPSNVLLSPRGPQVIDFGIARATDATALTRTGQTLGTPAFMSPEQATGAHLGPESDLFAFGGVLLFAGTGKQPFGTGDPAALLYRVVNEEPYLSGVPEGLLPLVAACLAKAPGERPDLDTVLADLTGTALPEAGADDPTEWLPAALATKVMRTVALTREQVNAREEPTAEEAPGNPEASAASAASGAAEEPAAAERTSTAGGAERPQESAEPARSVAGGGARPAFRERNAPAAPDPAPEPRGGSKKVLWGAALATLAVVAGVLVFDPTDTRVDERVDDRTDVSASEERSPDAEHDSHSPPPLDGPPPAVVQEVAWLDEDRFAVLSDAGVHLYETDRSEPVEELVGPGDRDLELSRLVTSPGETAMAVQDGGYERNDDSTVVVWDFEESAEYLVTLPDTFRSADPLALSPDGRTLYAGTGAGSESSGSREVAAYDTRSGEELYAVGIQEGEAGYQGSVQDLGTTPDGELLIGAVTTGLAAWDAATGEPASGVPELRNWPTTIAGPMGITDDVVATAAYDELLLWVPRSRAKPEIFDVPFDGPSPSPDAEDTEPTLTSLSIGDDGNSIVAAGHVGETHGFLRRWDPTGEELDERWTSFVQYRAAQASPTGEGVLVATAPLDTTDSDSLLLLDGDLEAATEFEIPTGNP